MSVGTPHEQIRAGHNSILAGITSETCVFPSKEIPYGSFGLIWLSTISDVGKSIFVMENWLFVYGWRFLVNFRS